MTLFFSIVTPLLALYLLFLVWYGGNGKPLRADEIQAFFDTLDKMALSESEKEIIPEIERLVALLLALIGATLFLLLR